MRKYSQVRVDDDTVLSAQQIKALQKRNAELEEENLILKSDCNLHATLRQRLAAIDALSGQHSVSILCRVLNVHRSTYYKHLRHEPSPRQRENVEIRKKILTLYAGSDKRLGAKKMKLCLAKKKTLFETTLSELGIRHKLIMPYTPRHNGKVEHSHRKDNEHFYTTHRFDFSEDFRTQLVRWNRAYNHFLMCPLNWQSPIHVLRSLPFSVIHH